ncbi:MAG: protein kinase [Archangium sp.]
MLCPRCKHSLSAAEQVCPSCGAPVGATISMAVQAPVTAARQSLESTVADIAQGDVLEDTWRVEKKLGEGGMGTVFLARDLKLDRDVAVKVLARNLCEDPNAVARFDREARMTARLDHPHIVPVFGVGNFQGRPFMVMKLLEGTSLGALLAKRKGAWPWSDVRAIIDPLAKGLTYLHAQGLVHRDVKPSNVYVSPTGHVTLLDFGVLKETARDLTATGQMVGTLRFMAPEQLTSASEVDARADLYALGVTLYRMLAGRTPFDGDDFVVAQRKVSEDPPSATSLNPTLPGPVGSVLWKAISRDPSRRFESVEAFVRALDDAYAGKDVAPPRASSKSKAPLFAAASVIAVLAIAGGVYGFTRPEVVATPPTVAVPKPEEPKPAVIAPVVVAPAETEAPVEPSPAKPELPKPAPVVAPKKKGPSRVSVVTMVDGKSSYADLIVDGVNRGETPTQLELTPGSHKLKVTRAGFQTRETVVKIVGGKDERVVLVMQR